ncbi:hypothetical protein EU527_11900 [Candidatus Thorarchaeota archaeon]|nr:MAG: hypothetical protein EU527_11900 [Candidatus Thorarchaeota archaeon]
MSESESGWQRVLKAFDEWIYYESSEFGPYTGYFSLENLRDLMHGERLSWMSSMIDEIIPGRIDRCREAAIAFEDFLPYMPDPDAREVVQSMIDLTQVIEDAMLAMSDTISSMKDEYEEDGLDEIAPYLSDLADGEENIRHHMSIFSQGFAKLRSLGLEMPDMES